MPRVEGRLAVVGPASNVVQRYGIIGETLGWIVQIARCQISAWLKMASAATAERVRPEGGELQAATSETDRILDSISDAFFAVDRNWRFTYGNAAAERMFKVAREDLRGRTVWEPFPEAKETEVWLKWHQAMETGRPVEFRLYYGPMQGWFEERVFPHENGLSIHIRDVTAEVESERQLERLDLAARQASESLQRLVDISPDLICIGDANGRFRDVSPSSEAILGYRPDELVGRYAADFVVPEEAAEAKARIGAVREGGNSTYVQRYRHKQGRTVHLQWSGTRSSDDGLIYAIGRDVTERVELERRLQHSQRLEAMGQLTGGIAHDFNNLLTVILGNAEMLEESLAGQELGELAALTRSAAERGAELTSRLLSFARRQTLQTQAIDVHALVIDMRALLERTLGEDVEVDFLPGAGVGPVAADRVQLEAAMLNLAINARDAMGGGGRLVIETAVLPEGPCGDEGCVMIAVRDSGSGMPPAVAARVFEPFFTTKDAGKGSGLGLSMIYGFARQSGGLAEIETELGAGTTVRLLLPVWRAAAAPEAEPEAAEAPAPRAAPRVLLVEDDALVRVHTRLMLRGMGYDVVEAGTGAEAVQALVNGEPLDLVFSDVVMPGGMSGRQLAIEAGRLRPELPILLTSGYEKEFGTLGDGQALLRKPYRRTQLADAIQGVLARAAA